MLHWIVFAVIIVTMLFIDLLVLNRKKEVPSLRQVTVQTLLWVTLGLAFAFYLALTGSSSENVQQYLAGYAVEYSLSIDNVFVWALIIGFFNIPKENQHAVLFWGVICAIVMRFAFIFLGVTAINRFAVVVVLLGVFLIWTAIGLARSDDEPKDISRMIIYRLFARILTVAEGQHGDKFFVREGGKRMVTMLMLCATVVGMADIVFAIDSVPAVLAISHDPFIVFSSNAMALMGLRSLYFLFDKVKDKFTRLDKGLAIILAGVGVKMIIASDMNLGWFHLPGIELPTWMSLVFIAVVLTGSVIASLIWPENGKKAH